MPHLPTTAAVVLCSGFRFGDDTNIENPNAISMTASTVFNGGQSPDAGFTVVFARNAIQSVKLGLVRDAINAHVQAYEPGIALLTNANIQISGLPV